jgi:hypothetical protein
MSLRTLCSEHFRLLLQECVGPKLPSARVTYPGSTAFCDGNSVSTTVRHTVGLGVFCDRPDDDFFFYGDLFFECADLSDRFDVLFDEFGLNEQSHYVCSQSATFPAGSLSSNTQVLPSVAITTDEYWLTYSTDGCFKISPVPMTPTPPTPSPITASPVSPFPTSGLPTQSPTDKNPFPTKEPTNIPITVAVPSGTRSVPPTTSEDSSSNVGAIAGGIAAGVVVLAVAAFFFIRKKGPSDNQQKTPVSSAGDLRSESQTNANTFYENVSVPPMIPSPDVTQSSSLATDIANARAPVVQLPPIPTSYSATPVQPGDSYDVQFKDQSRSVIGPSQAPAPMVVPGVPMIEAIPIAVPLDGSAATASSKNSIKSEPPGRRVDEA